MSNNKQLGGIDFLLSHIWTSDWVNYTRDEKLEVIEQAKAVSKACYGVGLHASAPSLLVSTDIYKMIPVIDILFKDISTNDSCTC